jgi:hypothetical protein
MDVDTIVIDPAVAIHDILPPPGRYHPDPMILGEVDSNGFCDGIIFYRVSHRLATFFIRILTLEYNVVEPDSSVNPQTWYSDYPPQDQRAMSWTMLNYRDIQERFLRIPNTWFGSYHPIIPSLVQGLGEDGVESPDAVRGQLHLAGSRKHNWPWEEVLHMEEDGYRAAAEMAREGGVQGNGLDLMSVVQKLQLEVAEWWSKTEPGIEGIQYTHW